jgi:hypothetical protein
MPCYGDCVKCSEHEDCALEDDLKYPIPEMIYDGEDLLVFS